MKTVERIAIFSKAQISAFSGGLVDYLTMVFLTEVFAIHYTISIAIGGIIGAVVNFSLNKQWAFYSKDKSYRHSLSIQLMRFSLIVFNSILMKDLGTYFITKYGGLDYKLSRIITDIFVSIAINYTLQNNWVFKRNK